MRELQIINKKNPWPKGWGQKTSIMGVINLTPDKNHSDVCVHKKGWVCPNGCIYAGNVSLQKFISSSSVTFLSWQISF